ncbi:MAG: hypothetical protein QXG12_04350 [Thermoproteota archaeon]
MRKVDISIVNVVATCSLPFRVDLEDLACRFPEYVKLNVKYPKYRCAYIKIEGMKGKVIVFNSGKMICTGARSIEDAENDLMIAYRFIIESLKLGRLQ